MRAVGDEIRGDRVMDNKSEGNRFLHLIMLFIKIASSTLVKLQYKRSEINDAAIKQGIE